MKKELNWIALQPDGQILVVGCTGQTIRSIAVEGSRPPMLIGRPGASHLINSSANLSGGTHDLVATVTGHGTVELWSPVSNSLVRSTKLSSKLSNGERFEALSGDARLVATIDYNHIMRVRDIETGSLVHSHTCLFEDKAQNLAFSHSGRRLDRHGMDGSVQIWSLDAEVSEAASMSSDTPKESNLSVAPAADVVLLISETACEVWMNSGRLGCPR